MCDVRPVNETGDLDWKKIQSIGGEKNKYESIDIEENQTVDRYSGAGVNAYILGVATESSITPILHDPNFVLNDKSDFCANNQIRQDNHNDLLSGMIQQQQKMQAEYQRKEAEKKHIQPKQMQPGCKKIKGQADEQQQRAAAD